MKNLISLIYLLIPVITYSQDLTVINHQLDSLKSLKSLTELQLQSINREIVLLESKKTSAEYKNVQTLDYKINQKLRIKVRDKDNSSGTIIYEPKNGEILRLLDYNPDTDTWLVSINNKTGFVNEVFLQGNQSIDDFKKIIIFKKSQIVKQQKELSEKLVKQSMIDKYGELDANRIQKHSYWLGMTDEMARESLGNPTDINRSVGSWGTHEQWVYESKNLYLYFENGKLTSFQNSK